MIIFFNPSTVEFIYEVIFKPVQDEPVGKKNVKDSKKISLLIYLIIIWGRLKAVGGRVGPSCQKKEIRPEPRSGETVR